jgi:uncharacterized Ntn-hydrolase superfamily protein
LKRLAVVLLCLPALARAADMNGAFSIVARDPYTAEWGVACMSHAPACGNSVPWVQAGIGAIATQGETNATWGPVGLSLMREGMLPTAVADTLMKSDPGMQRRQVALLDRRGWPGGYSGNELVNWSGGMLDSNLAVQGNTMRDNVSLQAIYDSLKLMDPDVPMADRMLNGLTYANRLKADWRGVRSAALLIGRVNPKRPEDSSRYIYLRVDDDPDPIGKLWALYRSYRASELVGVQLEYAAWYRGANAPARAARDSARAADDVKAALEDPALGAPELNAMAWALAQHGAMLGEAWTAIEKARKLEPKSTELLDTAAEVRYRQGRAAEALALIEQAAQSVPLDEYLASRVEYFRKAAPGSAAAAKLKKPR